MRFHVLTLFPQMIEDGLSVSVLGRALKAGTVELETVDIRDFTQDKHRRVDDAPYGGGAGLLLQAQPVYDAYRHVTDRLGGKSPRTIYLTPQGRPFDQRMAEELSREEELIFLCGHYEGVDERVLEEIVTDPVSIGDYVLTGGELPAMVMIDAIARLVPGVLHNEESPEAESFERHLLEYPQYSRPEIWHGKRVPEVLFCGDHAVIEAWRLERAKERTAARRPDLYVRYEREERAIARLMKKKLLHRYLIETLRRGTAELLYEGADGVLLRERVSGVHMMTAADPEAAKRMLALLPGQPSKEFVVCQDFVPQILQDRYGMKAVTACRQAVYTGRKQLPVSLAFRKRFEIRRLTESQTSLVTAHYRLMGEDTEAYVKERIQAGAMYGAFLRGGGPAGQSAQEGPGAKAAGQFPVYGSDTQEPGELAGFIGMHNEGSLGMLEVLPPFRRQGVAAALEADAVNRLLQKGFTPYAHIIEGNGASIQLQEKLGLCFAREKVYWVS